MQQPKAAWRTDRDFRLTKICPERPNEMDLALPCKETNNLEGHQGAVRAVRFNNDGKLLFNMYRR